MYLLNFTDEFLHTLVFSIFYELKKFTTHRLRNSALATSYIFEFGH